MKTNGPILPGVRSGLTKPADGEAQSLCSPAQDHAKGGFAETGVYALRARLFGFFDVARQWIFPRPFSERAEALLGTAQVLYDDGQLKASARKYMALADLCWDNGRWSRAEQAWTKGAACLLASQGQNDPDSEALARFLAQKEVLQREPVLPACAGKWLVSDLLGHGMFGTVHKVWEHKLVLKSAGSMVGFGGNQEGEASAYLREAQAILKAEETTLAWFASQGFATATVVGHCGDDVIKPLIEGPTRRGLSRWGLTATEESQAKEAFRDLLARLEKAGTMIDNPDHNCIFDVARQEWVIVDP